MSKRFVSLSSNPGTMGFKIYNAFFKKYNIDATYTPIGTTNLDTEILKVKQDNVSGISISMPYKQKVIKYLNWIDPLVLKYNSCNTIVNNNGKYMGYNCDYYGILKLISFIPKRSKISILGYGTIGSMVKSILEEKQYSKINAYSLRLENWDERHSKTDVIFNCTNQGTVNNNSPVKYIPESTKLVLDVSIKPSQLSSQASENRCKYINGQLMYKYQFLEQFKLYTGILIDEKEYDEQLNELQI